MGMLKRNRDEMFICMHSNYRIIILPFTIHIMFVKCFLNAHERDREFGSWLMAHGFKTERYRKFLMHIWKHSNRNTSDAKSILIVIVIKYRVTNINYGYKL